MQDLSLFVQHHMNLSLAFGVLVVLLFLVEMLRLKSRAQHLSSNQLTQMINHQNAQVIDLRPADQFAKGHIIDSLSLPLSEFKEKSKKIEKLKTRPIILVCTKGFDSPKIATTLKTEGYNVHILRGGISGWMSDNLPLVKGH
jgi:rhodanese-related sulfurtransferase